MKKLDVVCIGAANIDTIARVARFPLTDEQVAVTSLNRSFGGSAVNTAVACAKLGLRVGFVGKVGNDVHGKDLMQHFATVGLDTSHVFTNTDIPSGQVFIAVSSSGEKVMYAFPGSPLDRGRDQRHARIPFIGKHRPPCQPQGHGAVRGSCKDLP